MNQYSKQSHPYAKHGRAQNNDDDVSSTQFRPLHQKPFNNDFVAHAPYPSTEHSDTIDDNASFNFVDPPANPRPYLSIYDSAPRGAATPYAKPTTTYMNPLAGYELDNIQKWPAYDEAKRQQDLPNPPLPSKNPFEDDAAADSGHRHPNGPETTGGSPYKAYKHSSVLPPTPPSPPPPHFEYDTPGYYTSPVVMVREKGTDPFNDPHAEAIDIDESGNLERKRIKAMNKQRKLLLNRKPQWHYTNLPFVTIIFTVIQVCVFIAELAKMSQLTGSAFQTKPYFNPMLGPSAYILINMGARYAPCMHQIGHITNDTSIQFPCPNSTTTETNVCSLPELCGFGTIKDVDNAYILNQWFRLITPMFLHAGFLHILFNLILQLTMGSTIEKHIGWVKYLIIYVASGIGGFLLGANFSPDGIASTGASGAIFGILAVNILSFIFCGKKNTNLYGTNKFGLFVFVMITEVIISFGLGLLPGMDNFSHIGGFAVGLGLGFVLLPDPAFCYIDHIIVYDGSISTWQQFLDGWNPFYNWEHKISKRVYMWIAVRASFLILVIAYYGALIANFFKNSLYAENNCSWCKYLNCIPVNGWCDNGEITFENSNPAPSSTSSSTPASSSPTSSAVSAATSEVSTPLPSSISNPNGNSPTNQGGFKRDYDVFSPITDLKIPDHRSIVQSDSLVEHQQIGVSIGLCFILGMITLRFFRQKRWI